MKTLEKITSVILLSLIISCTNGSSILNENINSIKIDQKQLNSNLVSSLENSKKISNKILKSNDRLTNRIEIEQEILNEEENIIHLIEDEFSEFQYSPNTREHNENLAILLDIETITYEVEASALSDEEKSFINSLYNFVETEDFTAAKQLILTFKSEIESFDYSFEIYERANYLVNTFNTIYDTYSYSDINSRFSWSSVLKGALGGAIVGAVRGFAQGCITGVFLGFNPGSIAAGCMGGMIVGMVQGAVVGAIGGAVASSVTS